MGIAGFAMLGAFIGLIMTAVTGIRYLYWKRIGSPAVGTFGELISRDVEYKGGFSKEIRTTYYEHNLFILCNGQQYESKFFESISGDNPSKIKPGDKINLLFDPTKVAYFKIDDAKKKLKQYPTMFLVCIAIFIICAIVVSALS